MARDPLADGDQLGQPGSSPGLALSVRYHLPMVVAAVILALGLAGFYVSTASRTYTSSAVMLLSPAPGNPLAPESASSSGNQLTVAMETEEQLVFTAAVRGDVSEELGREVPADNERLEVTVPPNTQMLEVSFTAETPEAAQAGAQAFTEGYLAYRERQAVSLQESRIDRLQQQVEETDTGLQRAIEEEARAGGSSYASQEVQLLASRLATLTDQLSAAEAVGTSPGSVIDPAPLPEDSNDLPGWLILTIAAGVGLIGGVLMAFLFEWRRGVVRGGESKNLGVSVFATVPPSSSEGHSSSAGAVREAYRRVRGAVIAKAPRPHVIAVAPVDEEPSPTVAVDLAVSLGEADFSVLLIETGPAAEGGLPALVGAPGVAEVVGAGADPCALIVEQRGISVLPAGSDTGKLKDLTATAAFRGMVDDLRRQFDYVVLDAGGGSASTSDEALLAADSCLLVLTLNRTTRLQLGVTLERLDQLGVTTVGAVKVSRRRTGRTVVGEVPSSAVSTEGLVEDRGDSHVRT